MKDEYVYPRLQGQAPGMELRDWFAGLALQELIKGNGPWEAVNRAYAYADLMIEARNEEQTND